MGLLNNEVKSQLKKIFESLDKEVKLKLFTQKFECHTCQDTHQLLQEVSELSNKLQLEVFNFLEAEEEAKKYDITELPTLIVAGERNYNIRFIGIPAGYEFSSLLESIKMISTGNTMLSAEGKKFLNSLEEDIHLKVFVTPTCPYCPRAVVLAHQMAYYSDRVKADMVEVTEFPYLSQKYNVEGVPLTVINETVSQVGAVPEQMLIEKIKEAIR